MPITFSHPIVILPLGHTKLVFSALVIGSMSPDFLYFINLAPKGDYSHTPEGLFFFCLPIGLISLWIFHTIMKRPLIQCFPISHQEKLIQYSADFKFGGMKRFLIICISVFIGALTHVIWDGFTHERGWAVQRISLLSLTLLSTPFGEFKVYKSLQYAGHLFGLPLIIYFYYRWLKYSPATSAPPPQILSKTKTMIVLTTILFSSLILASFYGIRGMTLTGSLRDYFQPIGLIVILSINLSFAGVFLYCLYWNYKNR